MLSKWQRLDERETVEPSAVESIEVCGGDRVMLVEADSGDDIVYFRKVGSPEKISKTDWKIRLYKITKWRKISK